MPQQSFLVSLEVSDVLEPDDARAVASAIWEGIDRERREIGLSRDESPAMVESVVGVIPTASIPVDALAWILEIAYDMRRENVCDVVPARDAVRELADLDSVAAWYAGLPNVTHKAQAALFDHLPNTIDRAALASRATAEEHAAIDASDPDAMSGGACLDAATVARVAIFQSEGDTFYRLPGKPDVIGPFAGAYAAARDALHALRV